MVSIKLRSCSVIHRIFNTIPHEHHTNHDLSLYDMSILQVKIETSDDDQMTSIIAMGGKEDLERFSRTLQLPERGKVYVKGLFDDFEEKEGGGAGVGVIEESDDEINSIE